MQLHTQFQMNVGCTALQSVCLPHWKIKIIQFCSVKIGIGIEGRQVGTDGLGWAATQETRN